MSETGSALPIDELEQDAVLEQTEHAAGMEYDESIFYNFLMRREKEKNNKILVFELKLGSEVAEYKELTLRALLQLIHDEIAMIEIESIEKAKKNRDESNLVREEALVSIDEDNRRAGNNSPPPSGYHSRNNSDLSTVNLSQLLYDQDKSSSVLGLRLRDLRRLDFSINQNEELTVQLPMRDTHSSCHVQVRRHCVLFTVDPVRAIVTSKSLRLLVSPGADQLLSTLEEYMKEWALDREAMGQASSNEATTTQSNPSNKSKPDEAMQHLAYNASTQPYEIHTYESMLSTVKDLQTLEYKTIESELVKVLSYFKRGAMISLPAQEKMRALKDRVSRFLTKISNYRRSLEDICEEDEGMALMNLTSLSKNPSLYSYPLKPEILRRHEEIEDSLESYLMDFSSLESKLNNLKSQIQSAEEHVSLRLDISRNENLIANTSLAILSCSLGFGAYITGIFGMNLDQVEYLQPKKNSFLITTVLSFCVVVLLFFVVYYYFKSTGVIPTRGGGGYIPKRRSSW